MNRTYGGLSTLLDVVSRYSLRCQRLSRDTRLYRAITQRSPFNGDKIVSGFCGGKLNKSGRFVVANCTVDTCRGKIRPFEKSTAAKMSEELSAGWYPRIERIYPSTCRSRLFYFESPTEPNVMIKMSVTRFSYSASSVAFESFYRAQRYQSPVTSKRSRLHSTEKKSKVGPLPLSSDRTDLLPR